MTGLEILMGAGGVLVLTLAGAFFWLDRQFEEPSAKWVPSVAGALGAKSVLAVFAHPDDEQLIAGLLIRAVQQDGATTRMITATKGEAGTPLPQISRLEELGTIRHAEVLKNGYALGIHEQHVWDYPDGGLVDQDFEALVSRVQDQIKIWQADLIISFWPASGFSDHQDHKTIGAATVEAVKRLRETDPDAAPKAIAYILAPSAMMKRLGGELGKTVVANQPAPTHAMPGEGWAKIKGWDNHASQKGYVQKTYGMPPSLIHRLYDKENYYIDEF